MQKLLLVIGLVIIMFADSVFCIASCLKYIRKINHVNNIEQLLKVEKYYDKPDIPLECRYYFGEKFFEYKNFDKAKEYLLDAEKPARTSDTNYNRLFKMLLDIYLTSKPFDIKSLMKYYSNIANVLKDTERVTYKNKIQNIIENALKQYTLNPFFNANERGELSPIDQFSEQDINTISQIFNVSLSDYIKIKELTDEYNQLDNEYKQNGHTKELVININIKIQALMNVIKKEYEAYYPYMALISYYEALSYCKEKLTESNFEDTCQNITNSYNKLEKNNRYLYSLKISRDCLKECKNSCEDYSIVKGYLLNVFFPDINDDNENDYSEKKTDLIALRKKINNHSHSCTKKFENIFKEMNKKLTVLLEFVNAACLTNRIKFDKLRQFYEDYSNHNDKDVKICINIAKKYINSYTEQQVQSKIFRQKVINDSSNSEKLFNENSHIANHYTNVTQPLPPIIKKSSNIAVKENNSDYLAKKAVNRAQKFQKIVKEYRLKIHKKDFFLQIIIDQFPMFTYDSSKSFDENLSMLSNKITDELNKNGKTNCKYEMFLDFALLRLRQDRINDYIENLCIAYINGTFKQKRNIIKKLEKINANKEIELESTTRKELIRAGLFQYWNEKNLYKLYKGY